MALRRPGREKKTAAPDVAGLERVVGHLSQFGETSTSLVLSTVVDCLEFGRDPAAAPASRH